MIVIDCDITFIPRDKPIDKQGKPQHLSLPNTVLLNR
jgi:hypothetical protein